MRVKVEKLANRFDDKVASVSKALTILEELSRVPEGMGLIDISNKVEMHKTTVYRLLTSLMEKGFVEQDESSGKYSLGIKILSIASALYEKLDVRALVRKYAQELFQDYEGIILVTRELDGEYIVTDRVCTGPELYLPVHEGERLEGGSVIHTVFMANAASWQHGRSRMYGNPVGNDSVFCQKIKQAALQGYAEADADIGQLPAVAAPVFNFSKNVVYVVSIHSPVLAERQKQSRWILTLLELVNRVSGDLGFVNYV